MFVTLHALGDVTVISECLGTLRFVLFFSLLFSRSVVNSAWISVWREESVSVCEGELSLSYWKTGPIQDSLFVVTCISFLGPMAVLNQPES